MIRPNTHKPTTVAIQAPPIFIRRPPMMPKAAKPIIAPIQGTPMVRVKVAYPSTIIRIIDCHCIFLPKPCHMARRASMSM